MIGSRFHALAATLFILPASAFADIDETFRLPVRKNVVVSENITAAELQLLKGLSDLTLTVKVRGGLVTDDLAEVLNSVEPVRKTVLVSVGKFHDVHVGQLRKIQNAEVWVDLRVAPIDRKTVRFIEKLGAVRKKFIVPSGSLEETLKVVSDLNNYDMDIDVRYSPPPDAGEPAVAFPKGLARRLRISSDIPTEMLGSFVSIYQPGGVAVYAASGAVRTDLANYLKVSQLSTEVIVTRSATLEQIGRFADLPQLKVTFESGPAPKLTPKFVEMLLKLGPPMAEAFGR